MRISHFSALIVCLAWSLAVLPCISALAEVGFDPAGRMMIDGKTVFAVGLYVVEEPRHLPDQRADILARLDDIRNSPFDLLVDYGNVFGTDPQRIELLDEYQRRGLRVFVNLEGMYPDRWLAAGAPYAGLTAQQAISRAIEPIKNHPAVLGWYICDEYPKPEAVGEVNRLVRQIDPARPTAVSAAAPR